MRGPAVALAALAALATAAREARGAGFAVAEQSAAAAGTASAGTARVGDPAAAWFNPAALADGGGWRVGIGVVAAAPRSFAESTSGQWWSQTVTSVSTPPHVHASYAAGNLAGGVSLLVPFGGGVEWPEGWMGRYEVVSSSMRVLRAAPFLAWRTGRLRAACGVHLDRVAIGLERKLAVGAEDGTVALRMGGGGVGWDAALYLDATSQLALGLSYKSRTHVLLAGEADFTLPAEGEPDQRILSEVVTPDRLAVGLRLHSGRAAVLVDAELYGWSVYDRMKVDFASDTTPDAEQVNEWTTTLALRAGAEWTGRRGLTVRGGAFYDPSPVPASTMGPSAPDSLRVGFTLGLGQQLGRHVSADLFYEYLVVTERRDAKDGVMAASYSGLAHLAGVGVSYRR